MSRCVGKMERGKERERERLCVCECVTILVVIVEFFLSFCLSKANTMKRAVLSSLTLFPIIEDFHSKVRSAGLCCELCVVSCVL